jgi:hypothetical protein
MATPPPANGRPLRMATLPPTVPTDLPALDRLILLLGGRAKGPLTSKTKRELETLCGAYPDPPTAGRWKTELKALRADLIAEDARAHGQPPDETAGAGGLNEGKEALQRLPRASAVGRAPRPVPGAPGRVRVALRGSGAENERSGRSDVRTPRVNGPRGRFGPWRRGQVFLRWHAARERRRPQPTKRLRPGA